MPNWSELPQDLRDHIGEDISNPDFSDPNCWKILNRSFKEITNKYNFRQTEGDTTLATIANIGTYDLTGVADFEAVNSVYIDSSSLSFKRSKLVRSTLEEIQSQLDFSDPVTTNTVSRFYYRRENDLIIWPVPSDVYTITLFYTKTLEELTEDTVTPLPDEWYEPVLFGGVWRAYLRGGDVDRSTALKSYQANLMNSIVPVESKEENDSRESGVNYLKCFEGQSRRKLWK